MSEGVTLVTGITGLIGSALADRLVKEGMPVVGMDRVVPTGVKYPVITHDLPDSHRWHEAIVRYGVTRIVHAGGVSGPMLMRDAPARLGSINLTSMQDLLEACRIHGIQRLVWFSSIMAYGVRDATQPVPEAVDLNPTTVYGATKAAGEALIAGYYNEHGVDAVALRVASCYGPGRMTSCLIRMLVENGLAGNTTHVNSGEGRTRQYIYVDDVVDGVRGALLAPTLTQRVYNIGPGKAQSLDEIVGAVRDAVPAVSIQIDPDGMAWNTFPVGPLEIDAARRDFNFNPHVPLERGAALVRDAVIEKQRAV